MSEQKKSPRLSTSGVLDPITARKELRDMIEKSGQAPSYSVESEDESSDNNSSKKVRRFKDGSIVYE